MVWTTHEWAFLLFLFWKDGSHLKDAQLHVVDPKGLQFINLSFKKMSGREIKYNKKSLKSEWNLLPCLYVESSGCCGASLSLSLLIPETAVLIAQGVLPCDDVTGEEGGCLGRGSRGKSQTRIQGSVTMQSQLAFQQISATEKVSKKKKKEIHVSCFLQQNFILFYLLELCLK